MHSEAQLLKINSRVSLNHSYNRKLLLPFMYEKEENNSKESTNLSIERLRDDSHYSPDIVTAESFHCAIGPILTVAQIFGIFPVAGIRSSSPSKLVFKSFSFLTVYSAAIVVMILFMTVVSVIHMMRTFNTDAFHTRGGIGAATVGAVFYGNSLLGSVLFFSLSARWISVQCEWRAMEQFIDSNHSKITRLRRKFFSISSIVFILATVEHVLSVFNNIDGYDLNGSNATFRNFLQVYTLQSHSFIFNILDYNFCFGLYIFVVSKMATFTWNFTDLFVMLVATGLAERYESLNEKLATSSTKYRPSFDWGELREDYAILSCVVKKVDDNISPIILLSFANNLYFICLQLLNGLSTAPNSSVLKTTYFFGSFAFLVGRTCAVTLLAARINDQSRRALPYLYGCSAASYGTEAQRLEFQLSTDDVALTGLRFFAITRNFMLAVAGAIVTYEVVLLQFNVDK